MSDAQHIHIETPTGTVTGLFTATTAPQTPLLVCIHGGGSTAAYFDIEGASLLDLATAHGYPTLALDRPGYAGSTPLPDDEFTYERSARTLDDAIAVFWGDHGRDRPGVVLIGHSIGAAIAIHLAASKPRWPLLGISASGIGIAPPPDAGAAWTAAPPGTSVDLPAEARRVLLYGPESTVDPAVIEASLAATHPVRIEELDEVYKKWPTDLPRIAPEIAVPIHYALAELDTLWIASPASVAAFIAPFTRAPFVDASLFEGVGHNIDHHELGTQWHLAQLDFVEHCLAQPDLNRQSDSTVPTPAR